MDELRISLFGGMRLECDAAGEIRLPRRAQSLLAYLLVHTQKFHPREVLIDALWPNFDPESSHNCLNTTLWRLRKLLEPSVPAAAAGAYVLTNSAGAVGFNWESAAWVDVAALEAVATRVLAIPAEVLSAADALSLDQALELCRGDLLDGFYDDWVLRRREQVRRLQLNGIAHLVHHYSGHQPQRAVAWADRLLEIDPLREEMHRRLMLLYLEMGQAPEALRQYERCRALLAAELGAAPMAETRALHLRILQSLPDPPPALHAPLTTVELTQQLTAALHALEETQRLVQTALASLRESAIAT